MDEDISLENKFSHLKEIDIFMKKSIAPRKNISKKA